MARVTIKSLQNTIEMLESKVKNLNQWLIEARADADRAEAESWKIVRAQLAREKAEESAKSNLKGETISVAFEPKIQMQEAPKFIPLAVERIRSTIGIYDASLGSFPKETFPTHLL